MYSPGLRWDFRECINNSLHLAREYARIFVHGHYLLREANSFPRTVSFEEQILFKDKISEHIFAAKLRLLCLLSIGFKNWEYPQTFPSFSWGIFAHVTRLDQSRDSENISWIIKWLILAFVRIFSWQE